MGCGPPTSVPLLLFLIWHMGRVRSRAGMAANWWTPKLRRLIKDGWDARVVSAGTEWVRRRGRLWSCMNIEAQLKLATNDAGRG